MKATGLLYDDRRHWSPLDATSEPVRRPERLPGVFSFGRVGLEELISNQILSKEKRVHVAEIAPGTVSLMPQGLDAVISEQDLADLVVFLKSLK